MALPVDYRRTVGRDLAGGFGYYEGQREGLGDRLLAAVESAFDVIERYPEMFSRFHGELHLEVGNSPFAHGHGASPEPVCAPITGMLGAVASIVIGVPAQVVEHGCACAGDAICRLSARP